MLIVLYSRVHVEACVRCNTDIIVFTACARVLAQHYWYRYWYKHFILVHLCLQKSLYSVHVHHTAALLWHRDPGQSHWACEYTPRLVILVRGLFKNHGYLSWVPHKRRQPLSGRAMPPPSNPKILSFWPLKRPKIGVEPPPPSHGI